MKDSRQPRSPGRNTCRYRGICTGLVGAFLLPAMGAAAAEAPAAQPSWQLGLRSTAYMFQIEDANGATEDRF